MSEFLPSPTTIVALAKIGLLIGGLMTAAAYLVLVERWMAAWVQDRKGPNRVGIPLTKIRLFGLGQPLADGLKIILKEDFTPKHVDKVLYAAAPLVLLAASLAIFAAIPFGSVLPPLGIPGLPDPIPFLVAPALDVGVLWVFALSSIAVYGVLLGGWASNNKYGFLGGLRSSAQLVAYEIPLGLGLLGVVLAAGSLKLDAIINAQAETVHLTPPLYGGPPGKPGPAGPVDYDAVLTAYSEWLVSKRADGWLVIDVHGPMKRALEERRKKDPTFSFAADAVHPGDEGHWEIARAVIAGLGDDAAATNPDLPEVLGAFLPDVTKRMQLLRDAYLAAAGHLRPGMKPGLPLPEAEAQAALITASLRDRRLQLRGRKHQSGEWRIPIEWPRPKVVAPGPAPAGPAPVPADAIVLFDGSTMDAWKNAGSWKVADGVVTVGQGMIESKQGFGDCQLHLEFRMPAPATGKGQGRGNSGVFLMGQYEIQVLDSFEDGTDGPLTYPDGQCGALYKQQPPAVNACRPPGEWQTYDILFTRPRFTAAGLVAKPGRVSVVHNGVAIHSDTVIKGPTAWHEPPAYKPHPDALPIRIQDHGNPVQFRNIWVRPIEPVVPVATAP